MVKVTECINCGTKTSSRNHICALCKAGITKIHNDLTDLLKEDDLVLSAKKKKAG